MKKRILLIILVLVLVLFVAGLLWYFFRPKSSADTVPVKDSVSITLNNSFAGNFNIDPANSLDISFKEGSGIISLNPKKTTHTEFLKAKSPKYMGRTATIEGTSDYITAINDGAQTNDPQVALSDSTTDKTYFTIRSGQIWFPLEGLKNPIPSNAKNINVYVQSRTIGQNPIPFVIGMNTCVNAPCSANGRPTTWTPEILNNPSNTIYAGLVIPTDTNLVNIPSTGIKISRLVAFVTYDTYGDYIPYGKISALEPQYFDSGKAQTAWTTVEMPTYNSAVHKVLSGSATFQLCASDVKSLMTDCASTKTFLTYEPGSKIAFDHQPRGRYAKFFLTLTGDKETPVMPTQYKVNFSNSDMTCSPGAYYYKNYAIGKYTGVGATVQLGKLSPDQNRTFIQSNPERGLNFCKSSDNASVYIGIKNVENGQEIDVGLSWEVGIDEAGKISPSQSVFRPFWRAPSWDNADLDSNHQWKSGDKVTMEIKIESDDNIIFSVIGEGKKFSQPITVGGEGIKKDLSHEVKFITAIDQHANEGKPAQPTNAKFLGTTWLERHLFYDQDKPLFLGPEIEKTLSCNNPNIVVGSGANGAQIVDVIGSIPAAVSKECDLPSAN